MISIIVAHANGQVIGRDGDQPFYIPADLRRFKQLTTGRTVIMGRKTFEAIQRRLGKPLPDRTNVVISRTLSPGEGYTVVPSLAEAIRQTHKDEESFIIGGARVYKDGLGLADKIYLTKVDADIPGDVFFPKLEDVDGWRITGIERFAPTDDNPYPYRWITLER